MKKILSLIRELFEVVLIAFLPLFIISQFVARPFIVQGASMEPNFHHGNRLIIDMISYRFSNPERGDVVVFRNCPVGASSGFDVKIFWGLIISNRRTNDINCIKRIIGIPGDHIALRDGDVFVNGIIIQEKYFSSDVYTPAVNRTDFFLTENQFFVMGDNRAMSIDSRNWGHLKKSDIIGLVRFRFWPLSELEFFRNSD